MLPALRVQLLANLFVCQLQTLGRGCGCQPLFFYLAKLLLERVHFSSQELGLILLLLHRRVLVLSRSELRRKLLDLLLERIDGFVDELLDEVEPVGHLF